MSTEQAIKHLIDELVETWNSRDGASFSRLFAENADYVTGSGVRLAGRRSIHDALIAGAPGSVDPGQVAMVTESIRFLGPDVAVVLCAWRMRPAHAGQTATSAGRAGLMTIVTQRAGNMWRIVALQNTDARS
jgi:uncharacterized protein (TIGR02246 family)